MNLPLTDPGENMGIGASFVATICSLGIMDTDESSMTSKMTSILFPGPGCIENSFDRAAFHAFPKCENPEHMQHV